MTLNAWYKIWNLSDKNDVRVNKICELLKNGSLDQYKVIFFQEIWVKKIHQKIVSCAAEGKFKYSHFHKTQLSPLVFSKDGLLTISQYPIDQAISHAYKFRRIPKVKQTIKIEEKLVSKGFLDTVVNVDGRMVHLINTHLAANKGYFQKAEGSRNSELRAYQINKIFRFTDKITAPIIFGGDLNLAPNGLGEKLEEDFPHKENSLYAKIKKVKYFFEAPGCAKKKNSDIITFSSKNTFNKSGKSEGQIDHIFCGSNHSQIVAIAKEGGIVLNNYFYDDDSHTHYNISDHFGFKTTCQFSFVR